MKEDLERAIELLQEDMEEHYDYAGTDMHEGMLKAIEVLEDARDKEDS